MYNVYTKITRPSENIPFPMEAPGLAKTFNALEKVRAKTGRRVSSTLIESDTLLYIRHDVWTSKTDYDAYLAANASILKRYYDAVNAYAAENGLTVLLEKS